VVRLGPAELKIVGLTSGFAYLAGTPALLLTLGDGQRVAFGAELSSAIITRGVPERPIAGMRVMRNSEVVTDLARPTAEATTTIAFEAGMLALVAAGILGLMTYLSALDRRVDFAVFKAVGVGNGRLLGGLVLESVALAVISAALAVLLAALAKNGIPIGVRFTAGVYVALFAAALSVGLLVSAVSVLQAARIDPALAFGRN
jgi:putative ABC transport system permease protein